MDKDFFADHNGLQHALDLLGRNHGSPGPLSLPASLPAKGLGSRTTLDLLAPWVLGSAAHLGDNTTFAHMDPPTPWLTWATMLWNASLNQNLLHPATAPVAREIEKQVLDWLAPLFGMTGGHMTPGSTLANLTALWAARECTGARQVVASDSAHLSIAKAAHILGLRYHAVPTDTSGAFIKEALPQDLSQTALVLTAGTTSTGAIDPLELAGRAAWTHVDAAWAGPLQLSTAYANRLTGIELADSVAISAHKLLFQPKESALVLFKDTARANGAISFGGAYLTVPNIGVLGSHGATAVPLLATLLAWGREGLASRIENCMSLAERFADFVQREARLELFSVPQTGVVVWRPHDTAKLEQVLNQLPPGAASATTIGGERWLRCVAANPNADIETLTQRIQQAIA